MRRRAETKNPLAFARRPPHFLSHGPHPVNSASANTLLSTPPCIALEHEHASPAKADETRWFREEIRPHESDLRGFLRARFPTLTDVDDIVQETYIRLLHARASGKTGLNRAYLFVVARNTGLDLVRRQQCVPFEPR